MRFTVVHTWLVGRRYVDLCRLAGVLC
ncbi:putative leader peptide [Actinomadura sp. HBU206391]